MNPTSLYQMAPDELVRTLIRAHWSQEDIAGAIETTQPTICRILSGKHKDPRYSVVRKLQNLVLNLSEFQAAA